MFLFLKAFWFIYITCKGSFTLWRQRYFLQIFFYAAAITMWTLQLGTTIPIFAINAFMMPMATTQKNDWFYRCRRSGNELFTWLLLQICILSMGCSYPGPIQLYLRVLKYFYLNVAWKWCSFYVYHYTVLHYKSDVIWSKLRWWNIC